MRILLDVDGVLADLVSELCDQVRHLGDKPLTPDLFTTPEFKDSGFPPVILSLLDYRMVQRGFVQDLPTYLGARKLVTDLVCMGHRPVFVTKPYAKSPTWAYDRQVWLEKTFGPDLPVVHTGHKELVRGDVLVEDNPENLSRWLSQNPNGGGVLVRRPWNRGAQFHPRLHVVDSLDEIPSMLG